MHALYKYIDHTADLGIEIYGSTLEELFVNVGRAIYETQLSGKIASKKHKKIKLRSESVEDLFIDWCRELLYNFSVRGFIPLTYEISVHKLSLEANLSGDIFDDQRHKIKIEIKNPTYHRLQIKKTDDHYQATIIFDV